MEVDIKSAMAYQAINTLFSCSAHPRIFNELRMPLKIKMATRQDDESE